MCRKASTLSNQPILPSCPKTIFFYHADSYGTNVAKIQLLQKQELKV